MGNVIVVIVLLALVLNALRMVHKQRTSMKDWRCTGNCGSCKMPCQAKRIYHRDASASDQ